MLKKTVYTVWKHHRKHIGIGCLSAAVLLLLIHHLLQPRQELLLSTAFVNEYENVTAGSPIMDNFLASSSLTVDDVLFDSAYFFDLGNGNDDINSYFQKLIAKLENGDVDVMIVSRDNLMGIAKGGRTLDLRDERAADLMERYPENILYYMDEDSGEAIPVGIDLSESSVLPGYSDEDHAAVALSSNLKHSLSAVELIHYLSQ